MTLADSPYTIVQVNKLWEDMTGYKAENVVGRASCRVLQGQQTDRSHVEKLMSERELSGVGRAIARVLSLAPDLSDQEGLDAFASMPGEIRACQNDLDVILSHAGGPDGLFDILPARGAIFVVGLSLHLKSVTNGNELLS